MLSPDDIRAEVLANMGARTAMQQLYLELFGTPIGERVLQDLLGRCGLLQTSMVVGDSHDTAFREGKRSVALELLSLMRWTEGRVVAMSSERALPTAPDPDGEFE